MRILFTRFPYESTHGGAEVQTLTLAESFAARGHTVEFMGSCEVLLKEFRIRKLKATMLDIGKPPVTKWLAVNFYWRRKKMQEALAKAFVHHNVDAVIMLSMSEKLLTTEALARQGKKVLWVEHDRVGRWLTRNPWLRKLRKQSAHAWVVTVSNLSKSMYKKMRFPVDRLVVIPNGIDLERFPLIEKSDHAIPPLRAGCVARLSPEKGVDILIEAATDIPEVDLKIVGSGPEEGLLRTMIGERNLGDRVTIAARAEDLGDFYQSCDVIVLPSADHDPFGLTAAEAMALGIPVIVTDACGIAGELHDGEDALIVPAGNIVALRDALHVLATDSSFRAKIANGAKTTAERRFGAGVMAKRYETLLAA